MTLVKRCYTIKGMNKDIVVTIALIILAVVVVGGILYINSVFISSGVPPQEVTNDERGSEGREPISIINPPGGSIIQQDDEEVPVFRAPAILPDDF